MELKQRLLFVLGKGGVGRTTLAAALGVKHARQGEKVLLVQWAFHDSLGAVFDLASTGHAAQELVPNLFTMNFSASEAMREYFVSHLKMRHLYELVIQNSQVQRLVRAVPGVQELFFLGRLFWLIELSEQERGWRYDRVIVDAPATGHGAALFSLPRSIASFGIAGPLANECQRVSALLEDRNKVGTIVVTIPEELPVEETVDLLVMLRRTLGRPPLLVFVNRCLDRALAEVGCGELLANHCCHGGVKSGWLGQLSRRLSDPDNVEYLEALFGGLCRRREFEAIVRTLLESEKVPACFVPDIQLRHHDASCKDVVMRIADVLLSTEQAGVE